MRNLRYSYKPSLWRMALVVLLFGGGSFFMYHEAQTNDRGLIINGIIELGVDNATRFFWGMAVFCVLLTAVGIWGVVVSFASARELVLTETTLTVPGGIFSSVPKVVQIASITGLDEQKIQGQRFLYIHHPGGKIGITASLLPKGAFDELCAELETRVGQRGHA